MGITFSNPNDPDFRPGRNKRPAADTAEVQEPEALPEETAVTAPRTKRAKLEHDTEQDASTKKERAREAPVRRKTTPSAAKATKKDDTTKEAPAEATKEEDTTEAPAAGSQKKKPAPVSSKKKKGTTASAKKKTKTAAAPTKVTKKTEPAVPDVSMLERMQALVGKMVGVYVPASLDEVSGDAWHPGKLVSVREENQNVFCKIQYMDKVFNEIELNHDDGDEFPSDGFRLLQQDENVVYLLGKDASQPDQVFYTKQPMELRKGDVVFCKWGKFNWFRGRVALIETRKARTPAVVQFDDGDKKKYYCDKAGYKLVWKVNDQLEKPDIK